MKMKISVVVAVAGLAVIGVACGTPVPATSCQVKGCPTGQVCDLKSKNCLPMNSGGGVGGSGGTGGSGGAGGTGGTGGSGGSGGGGAFSCPSCSGGTGVCDSFDGVCKACTLTQGCVVPTPYCFISSTNRCVQCRTDADCAGSNVVCEQLSHTCQGGLADGGTNDGGAPDAGHADSGVPDAGNTNFPFCVPRDGGVISCGTECQQGFTCVGGICVLNGANGPIQVTLKWNTSDDLDLHLDEPTPSGPCEIYYGDTNDPDSGTGSSCNAVGTLDLDSEAGCANDGIDIENIIYPAGTAPSGLYTVRVDHYEHCSTITPIPFQVEVRNNGVISGVCGVFTPSDPDWENFGGAGDGRQVMTFTVP